MKILFYLAICVFSFVSCKKGEEDPVLSMRTRKARLTGEWRMVKGSMSEDYTDKTSGEHYDGVYTLDGSRIKGTISSPTSISAVAAAFILNVTFDKDGTFVLREISGTNEFQAKGTWNFSGRVGENKNKESIVCTINSVLKHNTYSHYFNQFNTTFTYKIKQLKNKELILMAAVPLQLDNTGNNVKFQAELSFIQD